MAQVALIRCESYDIDEVREAVKKGLALIGGIGNFIKKNEKVLLKPNLLAADPPEKCVTTHPAVFRAVAELALGAGPVLSYGDSPAMGNTETAVKKAGLAPVADELGITLADFKNGEETFFEKGVQNKKFTIARGVIDSDAVISLPKLKTHGLEKFTGSVKNQFGCVPGFLKGEFHIRLPDAEHFARMLVDLNNLVHPRLYIMDGIMAMEGNGPRGGKPKAMNILLFSADPIALDATVCRIIGLDPELVPTIRYGAETGMGTFREDEIEILGENIHDFYDKTFEIERTPLKPYRPKKLFSFISNRLVPKPVIIEETCIKCGICVKVCPTSPKSVDWFTGDKTGPPQHNYSTCIRCYCCQELCPESAIVLKAPLIRRIFSRKQKKR